MRKLLPVIVLAGVVTAAVVVVTMRRRAASDLALMSTPVGGSDEMPVPPGV
jgi:hypothetical protein